MSGRSATIGIDIGGTSVRAAVVDEQYEVLEVLRAPTPHTVQESDDVLARLITELQSRHRVSAVGLAVAGFLSTDRRTLMFAPHLAWRDDPLPERLSQRLGLPVTMDHDVNSAAWAEYRLGAAAGSPVALLIAIGTGIGAGLVADGVIYRGAHGVAPELGHIVVEPGGRPCSCGKRGCWERYCSGTALAATAQELLERSPSPVLAGLSGGVPGRLTGAMVAQAAGLGDEVALAAMAELSRWLGVGLTMATDVLDPEVIVVGGGVAGAADFYLPGAIEYLLRAMTGAGHRPAPRVTTARFGASAGIIGAALLAAELVTAA